VDWSKELINGGEYLTQDQHIERLKGKEWKLADAELYNETILALYDNRDNAEQKDLIKKVKEMFANDFRQHYMMTGTRMKWSAASPDWAMHDYRQEGQRDIETDLVGPDGWINESSGLEKPISAILGTKELGKTKEAYTWLSGCAPYLWRFNHGPASDTERAVLLGLSGSYDLFAILASNFNDSRPARGCDLVGREKSP
jgi:hypothetical protein